MLNQYPVLSPGLSFYQDVCLSSELRLVARLTDLIDLHFRAYRKCDFYCGQLGYTVRCLNDVTVFHTGKTVYEMIQERLLAEAKRLLVYSRMSAKCVAYELGFTRHDYFSRWFKKMSGYTAKEYRERNNAKYQKRNQIQIK
jgi:AraC family transcriptional activator of pobA